MTARNLQSAAFVVSAIFIPVAFAGENWISRSNLIGISFLTILYASVLTAVAATFARYRKEVRSSLAKWRRIPYEVGLSLLLALSLCPVATWLMALSGVTPHSRFVFLFLLGANATAMILVWFGGGWSRLGLTIVGFWICFLWAFPLGVGV
jgi:hypothetical protein